MSSWWHHLPEAMTSTKTNAALRKFPHLGFWVLSSVQYWAFEPCVVCSKAKQSKAKQSKATQSSEIILISFQVFPLKRKLLLELFVCSSLTPGRSNGASIWVSVPRIVDWSCIKGNNLEGDGYCCYHMLAEVKLFAASCQFHCSSTSEQFLKGKARTHY